MGFFTEQGLMKAERHVQFAVMMALNLQVKLNESMRTGIILSGTDTWVGK